MPNERRYPAAWLQQSLYDSAPGATSTLNVPIGIRLQGVLDKGRLVAALNAIVGRHEALRTRLVVSESGLWQAVSEEFQPVQLTEQVIAPDTVTEVCRSEFAQPFDLHGPLVRFRLWKIGERDHLLTIAADHTIMDGFSAQIILRELAALYAGEALEPPTLQFGDYAAWEHRDVVPGSVDYWARQLPSANARMELGVTPESLGGNMRTELYQLPEIDHKSLVAAARQWRVSVLAVLAALTLSSLQGYLTMPGVIGLFVGNRDRPELESTIGFVADLMPVPVPADPGRDLEALARGIAPVLEECHEYRVPLRSVRELLRPRPGRPLFDVTLNYLPALSHMDKALSAGGLSIRGELLEFLYPTRLNHGWYDGAAFLDYRWRARDGRLIGYLAANGPDSLGQAARTVTQRTGDLLSAIASGNDQRGTER